MNEPRIPDDEFHGPIDPPPDLESRVVASLHDRGLLKGAPANRGRRTWIPAAAAAALVFVAGLAIGRVSAPVPAPAPATAPATPVESGSRFALLLYEDASFDHAPAGAEAERVAEYVGWLRELRAAGVDASGEKLASGGVALGTGASAPEKNALAGFFTIEAEDVDRAREIAATCPHLRYGGRVVIRRLEG